jgi:hypothetical protein
MQTLQGLRADLAKWPASAVAHALTTAAVDVTRGLRADLAWSAFHLENAAALWFQQGTVQPYMKHACGSELSALHIAGFYGHSQNEGSKMHENFEERHAILC